MMRHYLGLSSASYGMIMKEIFSQSETLPKLRHQNFCACSSDVTVFCRETIGDVAKCRLFSQVKIFEKNIKND